MPSRLQVLADEVIARSRQDILLTLSEGLVKVRCAEAALVLGWTIQEGVGNRGVADYARLVSDRIVWWRGPRSIQLLEGSSDLAIVEPFELLIEIKARPDHGTKSQAQFQQMDEDVARVAQFAECALLFVFGCGMYRTFCGDKAESRGRKAVAADWFRACFPPLEVVGADHWTVRKVARNDTGMLFAFRVCPHVRSDDTVFVIGARDDSGASLGVS